MPIDHHHHHSTVCLTDRFLYYLLTMKAIILLAVFALAAARPEPPAPKYGPPAGQYGPPNFQSGKPIGSGDDPLAEPASYNFEYKVEDAEAGLNFGHQEAREGEEAKGEYFALLPDGRTIIVSYTANEDGYQPEIRFEEPKPTRGSGSNGYY